MVDDRGEVSGPVELNGLQTLVVGLHYALNTCAVWVLRVPVLQRRGEARRGLPSRINLRRLQQSSRKRKHAQEWWMQFKGPCKTQKLYLKYFLQQRCVWIYIFIDCSSFLNKQRWRFFLKMTKLQVLWLQNKPRSSALLHRASQLVFVLIFCVWFSKIFKNHLILLLSVF